jgi:hypothetical protein
MAQGRMAPRRMDPISSIERRIDRRRHAVPFAPPARACHLCVERGTYDSLRKHSDL